MKNKLIFLTVLILLIPNCSHNNKPENPLIVPPAFNELPDVNNPQKPNPKSNDQDLQELKELLLKN